MSISTIFSFVFFLLTSGICHLPSTTAVPSRRSLHQPFFPVDSSPPQQPSPKYPFSSTSNSTSSNSPFFPTYPSPPPPPSPASFASFPANISSLILPHSPSNSSTKKVLPLAIVAIVISLLVSAVTAILYIRRRRRRRRDSSEDVDSKTTYSSANAGRPPTDEANIGGAPNRPGTGSANSTEFLYLGTIANSRGVDASRNASRAVEGSRLDPRKLDSPDLQPLPPLARQSYRHTPELSSAADETEEEFYSPRGSLGRTESSIGAGSGSRRVFACLGANLDDSGSTKKVESTSSSSSSSSDSPARRSKSISLSPPVSLSPRRSQTKSPAHISVEEDETEPHYATPEPDLSKTPLLSSSQSTSPDRGSHKSVSRSSSVVSDRKRQSPSLSPLSWSTGKGLERNPDISLRLWNVLDSNRQSHSSSLHSSPSPGRRSSISSRTQESRVSSPLGQSPDRDAEDDQSDRFSLPSHSSSSPSLGASPATSNRTMQVPPPVIGPPPPPPPPPPPLVRRLQESQPPLTPTDQPITRPPPLTPPPSQPFLFHNSLSPVELLPPSSESAEKLDDTTPKPKLKPLHWDKVKATSDREMVWDQLRSSSFKLNEEMIESLFVVNNSNSQSKDPTPRFMLPHPNQENRVLDPKKSQNIAILLRGVNVTIEEVCEALLEGNTDTLGAELLESLLKMSPTKEEERKLKDYKDNSPIKLGPAEKFLKSILDVPYAFKRLEALLYIVNFESEIDYLKKSFETLEVACEELRNSRMFMKLLEAVLKTGNRMNVGTNRGDAHAFKLDTLLKLADVKGADGKTTLLHFVVQEIVRSEGARLSTPAETAKSNTSEDAKCRKLGLQVVSSLTSDLTNVKKAAAMDSDVLHSDVHKLFKGIETIAEIVKLVESTSGSEDSSLKFSHTMNWFTKMAEEEIIRIQAQESVSMSLVKEITEYFHGDSAKEEAHPFRIFMVVRDFLTVLDRVCREVGSINDRIMVSSAHRFPIPVNPLLPVPVNPLMPQVLPPFNATQRYSSSSDDGSSL